MNTSEQLKLERRNLGAALKKHIEEASNRAGGNASVWSDDDSAKFDQLSAQYDALTAAVDRNEKLESIEAEHNRPVYDRRIGRDGADVRDDSHGPRGLRWGESSAPMRLTDSSGKSTPVLRPCDRLANHVAGAAEVDENELGRALVAKLTGRFDSLPERIQNLLSAGTGADGGFTIPSQMSARIIDLARAKSVCVQAGALTLPLEAGETTFVKVTGDPTAYWRGESARITESKPTFGALVMRPKTLGCIVGLPVELAEDGRGIIELVQNGIAQAMALEVDRVALRGTGSGIEPTGIANTTGITETPITTALAFDDLLDALTPIENANGMAGAVVMHPTQNGQVRKLKDGTGNYLIDHPALNPLRRLVSKQQTSGVVTVGDFSQLAIGVRTNLTVETFRSGTVGSNDALSDLLVYVRAYLRADVAVLRPDHFNVLTIS